MLHIEIKTFHKVHCCSCLRNIIDLFFKSASHFFYVSLHLILKNISFSAGSSAFQFGGSTTTNQQASAFSKFRFRKTETTPTNTGSSAPAPAKTGGFSFGGGASTGNDVFKFGGSSSNTNTANKPAPESAFTFVRASQPKPAFWDASQPKPTFRDASQPKPTFGGTEPAAESSFFSFRASTKHAQQPQSPNLFDFGGSAGGAAHSNTPQSAQAGVFQFGAAPSKPSLGAEPFTFGGPFQPKPTFGGASQPKPTFVGAELPAKTSTFSFVEQEHFDEEMNEVCEEEYAKDTEEGISDEDL